MTVEFHKDFKKNYKKLNKSQQARCDKRIILFINEPFHPVLNNHALSGEYGEYRSINISGDLRALYQPISKNKTFFIDVGTHSYLFG